MIGENNITVFCDLDGPILNNKNRHYNLYKDILTEFNYENYILPKNKYWALKRDKVGESEILSIGGLKNKEVTYEYINRRLALIESRYYLSFNRIVNGAKKTLEILRTKGRVFLITTRRSRDNLLWELQQKRLLPYFNQVLSSPPRETAWDTKVALISQIQYKHESTIIIGDTEAEIIAGKLLSIPIVAVLNGIRSEQIIRSMNPDLTVNSIQALVSYADK